MCRKAPDAPSVATDCEVKVATHFFGATIGMSRFLQNISIGMLRRGNSRRKPFQATLKKEVAPGKEKAMGVFLGLAAFVCGMFATFFVASLTGSALLAGIAGCVVGGAILRAIPE